jgi:DUF4097 and DUF4098 domain-containing protein YvlB
MKSRGAITGPLVLILLGVLFLVRALSPEFHFVELLAHYWPYGVILWGVIALLEVCIRFRGNGPIPRNGVSGGGWVVVVLIALLGSSAFEFQRPDNWLRQVGFENGMEAFGQEHEYPLDTISKNVGPAPRIVIEDFRGDAKISGTDGTEISLAGQKTIRSFDIHEADRANTQSPVEIVTEGNTVIVRCHQDRISARSSVSTNLDLSVPKGARVEATSSHGTVDISAVTGDVEFNGGNGSDIKLEDLGGNVKLETRGADSIHCNNVKGSLTLHGRGSEVDLENIAGQVTVGGDYTGTVSLRSIAKPVHVENMRTQLDAQRIPGYVRLDRGSLDANNLIGPLKLSARSTDITLASFTEGLDLDVDRGDVELRPEHAAMGRITVHARSGDIELAVPAAARFAITANTANGEIDNEFGGGLQQNSDGRGAKLEGSVGSGPDVNLVTQHGSITVRKASGENAGETKAAELRAPGQTER